MFHRLLLLGLILISSCSPKHQDAQIPTYTELKKIIENSSRLESEIQALPSKHQSAILYRWAKLNEIEGKKSDACHLFTALHTKNDFVSENHLILGILKNCSMPESTKQERLKALDLKTREHWSREDFLRDASDLLEKTSNPASNNFRAEILLNIVDYEPNQEAKISSLQQASKLANKEDLKEIIREKLQDVAPRFIKNPSPEKMFSVARDLERARDFSAARSLYEKLLNNPQVLFEDKMRSFDRIALSYKVQRSREAYLKELEKIESRIVKFQTFSEEETLLKNKHLIDHMITRARALWTAHNREAGQKILREAEQTTLSNNDQMAQISFVIGSMYVEAGNLEKAQQRFKNGILFKTSDTKIAELLYWSLGWSYYLSGQLQQAIGSFSDAAMTVANPAFVSKVRFWEARSHLKINNKKRAYKLFNKIINEDPYSFYAFLSKHEQDIPFKVFRNKTVRKNIDQTFDWLILLDEKNAAKARLESLVSKNGLNHKTLIKAFSQGEMHKEAIFHFGRNASTFSHKEQKELIPYIYPKAYLELYQESAQRYAIPIELGLAITRQESAFDQDARSWADAFGLMQIIPEKAQQLSKELKIEYKHFSELYQPQLNINLGSYLLAKLYKKYNQEYPYYIASYNAGERPVDNWRRQRHRDDILEFIESIPYQETQNYVKLILRNKVIYRKIIGEQNFKFSDIGVTNF